MRLSSKAVPFCQKHRDFSDLLLQGIYGRKNRFAL
ncbi:Hypothetical protein, conserved [Brucella abortus str. 2308 A]|uniref:Uncharacterized protein n=1 Tax=Brucella ceti str. Cudo TaxID=595497 RepID=C0G7Z3_9HYPH|nr:hypothetical protein BMNI_I1867 [Brucella melitensis NI]EEH14034.1 Hypothetical protein, conserved [Brucella ceti str. Cudo]EEP62607.1 Hypothetical protein, conserved [Brucella abortus str. 2308 A]